ncbi:nitronate monooxygenase [Cellulomonas fimi]|uniref:Propionate 3-nitronate monooxygenase n=1 Tax=Cellulomonas fimi TaxID=1708 RepID=A0A7Y0LZU2_CELFI|nr:nitronate monooxygenase [Cellulomonas fimi]
MLDGCRVPVVLAPMAGGPSTPELCAGVSEAGGLGFLAAGYLTAADLAARIDATRRLTDRPFGVNVFVPGSPGDAAAVAAYARRLEPEATRLGVGVGQARVDDDDWTATLDLLAGDPVPVVSFTFGCPAPEDVARLRDAGSEVWVTVTSAAEARLAQGSGADALVVQGAEAGGHRGGFTDADDATGLLALLQLVRVVSSLPMIAAGAIMTGAALAGVLAAGARAGALGTAFLRCPEAGTVDLHRQALARGDERSTRLTRAFTGRLARGLENRFLLEHSAHAPSAYPEVHFLTAPLRAAARAAGDAEAVNLWAGQAHPLGTELPAGEVVARVAAEARAAVEAVARLLV